MPDCDYSDPISIFYFKYRTPADGLEAVTTVRLAAAWQAKTAHPSS